MKLKNHSNAVSELGKRMPPSLKNGAGFSIMEVLVALLVLIIGLLGLLRVMPLGLEASRTARDVTTATYLAQGVMDAERTSGWPDTGTASGNFASEGYPDFEYILDIASTGITNLREATVSVSWPVGATTQRTVVLKTYMARYD